MVEPTLPTIKRLFAISGSLCAMPKCHNPLIDAETGIVTGRICHIKAKNPSGPRYDKNQSERERNSFDNLILFCPIHHDIVDKRPDKYSVEKLLEIKKAHESSHVKSEDITDTQAQEILNNIKIDEGSVIIPQNQKGGQVAHKITNVFKSNVKIDTERIKLDNNSLLHNLNLKLYRFIFKRFGVVKTGVLFGILALLCIGYLYQLFSLKYLDNFYITIISIILLVYSLNYFQFFNNKDCPYCKSKFSLLKQDMYKVGECRIDGKGHDKLEIDYKCDTCGKITTKEDTEQHSTR